MIYYQIMARGWLVLFDEKTTHFSKYIYKNQPSEQIINKFIESCTSPINNNDFTYLNKNKDIQVKILEVITVND